MSNRHTRQAYDLMAGFGLQHQRERAIYRWLLAEARWWAQEIYREWGFQEGVSYDHYRDEPVPAWMWEDQ